MASPGQPFINFRDRLRNAGNAMQSMEQNGVSWEGIKQMLGSPAPVAASPVPGAHDADVRNALHSFGARAEDEPVQPKPRMRLPQTK